MKIRKFDQEDYDVLIISYDQLKIYCEEIAKIRAIDLLIADEGHRLKVCAV
jgi:DNA repair and recombination protein RAD54 and RAD54-like protein